MTKGSADPIDEITSGYKASQILLTANRLGLFAALETGPLSATELASRLDTNPRATRILCDALASLSLLNKTQDRYGNSELAAEFLLPDSAKSRSAMLLHSAKLYERWSKLYDVVRTGQPVPESEIDPRLLGDGRAQLEPPRVLGVVEMLDAGDGRAPLHTFSLLRLVPVSGVAAGCAGADR